MLLNRTADMKFPFLTQVSGVRFFGCVEYAEMMLLSIEHKLRRESSVPSELHASQASTVGLAGEPAVLHVNGVRNIAKIGYGVVLSVAVYVINFSRSVFASGIQPSKVVALMVPAIKLDASVSSAANGAGYFADLATHAHTDGPSEMTRLGAVVQDFAQAFNGKHRPSQ